MSKEEQMLDELKQIREALVPKPPPPPGKRNLLQEFKDFIMEYKVMGLAVAFIMALYLGRLVQALVTAWITPIINIILISIGLLNIDQVLLTPSAYPLAFNPTLFISELITFIIVAFVIFLLVKLTTRLGIK
ncbi:MAG: MscL family protein [Candidatus Thorarchaeota archaeon]